MEQLNKILSKHVDDGKFPGIQWQINIKNETPVEYDEVLAVIDII